MRALAATHGSMSSAASVSSAISSPGSVTIGTGLTPGLQLVVGDIQAARAELVEQVVEVSAVQHIEEGIWVDGPGGPWNSVFFVKDPDGNDWAVQEKPMAS
jgi:hypothetical protein